ncbi:hypothetical protein OPT61_g2570 [Boeremia exigua]|uniref:Uncharacterized protein n=1 Tax=Boeremia exigua TaxID=749465 RepID=A0ACC2IL14_9PLEO|nr:hypothetical protein OPT61_g2570 [Boeremia exigua]
MCASSPIMLSPSEPELYKQNPALVTAIVFNTGMLSSAQPKAMELPESDIPSPRYLLISHGIQSRIVDLKVLPRLKSAPAFAGYEHSRGGCGGRLDSADLLYRYPALCFSANQAEPLSGNNAGG